MWSQWSISDETETSSGQCYGPGPASPGLSLLHQSPLAATLCPPALANLRPSSAETFHQKSSELVHQHCNSSHTFPHIIQSTFILSCHKDSWDLYLKMLFSLWKHISCIFFNIRGHFLLIQAETAMCRWFTQRSSIPQLFQYSFWRRPGRYLLGGGVISASVTKEGIKAEEVWLKTALSVHSFMHLPI